MSGSNKESDPAKALHQQLTELLRLVIERRVFGPSHSQAAERGIAEFERAWKAVKAEERKRCGKLDAPDRYDRFI
jgi:hypothetical protein